MSEQIVDRVCLVIEEALALAGVMTVAATACVVLWALGSPPSISQYDENCVTYFTPKVVFKEHCRLESHDIGGQDE